MSETDVRAKGKIIGGMALTLFFLLAGCSRYSPGTTALAPLGTKLDVVQISITDALAHIQRAEALQANPEHQGASEALQMAAKGILDAKADYGKAVAAAEQADKKIEAVRADNERLRKDFWSARQRTLGRWLVVGLVAFVAINAIIGYFTKGLWIIKIVKWLFGRGA